MKIIVGVDDSPCSDVALDFVKAMVWPTESQIVVASAVKVTEAMYSDAYIANPALSRRLYEESVQRQQQVVERAEQKIKSAELATKGRVLNGDPREALVDLAKQECADLLVVGSHGRSGLTKLLLGSVASHVVGHAPCSVMVVKR